MPTKLKKPITLRIEHVENAVNIAIESQSLNLDSRVCDIHPNYTELRYACEPGEIADQIESQLAEQGIDWNTWLPEKPFEIAGRTCEFNPDGTVTLSCGTVITNEEIEEVLKRRETALDTTKYFSSSDNRRFVWCSTPKGNYWVSPDGIHVPSEFSLNEVLNDAKSWTRITNSQAACMVGSENL